jgi:Protein of unknown function (DUF429)
VTRVIAVDWSGRTKGAAEAIWLARVDEGQLVELENGLERSEVIASVIDRARENARTIAGFDFAFSFPRWYCEANGWATGMEVWRAMKERSEALLQGCEPPFWGRAGTTAQTLGPAFRHTDSAVVGQAKSVFQIGGAGAVGTGSLRGMPHLVDLAESGYSIWPFDPPGRPLAIEIYPRVFAPGVVKGRHRVRRAHLERSFPEQSAVLLERAAGSDDAFDAAVSALAMAAHLDELERIPERPVGSAERIEGEIWAPYPLGSGSGNSWRNRAAARRFPSTDTSPALSASSSA